jgi:hypothetical protein
MNFSLAYANPMTFLRRISKAENYDPRTRTLAKYFMELSLVHAAFVGTPGSLTAAGSVFLARRILGVAPPWVFLDYRVPNRRSFVCMHDEDGDACMYVRVCMEG